MMNVQEWLAALHGVRGCSTRVRCGFVFIMVVFITMLSLAPAYLFRNVESSLPLFPGFDKCVHSLMYFVLTLSVLFALPHSERRRIRSMVSVAVAASFYGIFMEFCQGFLTSTRSMDHFDMLANAVGAFFGAWMVWRLLIKGGEHGSAL